jgi:DNA primase
LVIPIYDEENTLIGIQGRSLDSKSIRYITIKKKGAERLWYGLNKISSEPVFVLEGPIDSMFLPNGVATLGMDSTITIPDFIKEKKLIFVIDNEPRNKNVVKTIESLIEKKFNVVIWPSTIREKDINDMILSGKTTEQLVEIITNNTYTGLQAKLKLNDWKKV